LGACVDVAVEGEVGEAATAMDRADVATTVGGWAGSTATGVDSFAERICDDCDASCLRPNNHFNISDLSPLNTRERQGSHM